MKSIFTFSLFIVITSFSVDANAQSNSAAQESTTNTQGQNIDLAAPAPEPAYVIGDDGQKVYFLTNPVITPKDPSGKQVEINQRQSPNEPAIRKPE